MSSTGLSPVFASLCVALGGAMGALARFQLGRLITHTLGSASGFPWATLMINVTGSLAMGVLLGWLARGSQPDQTSETLRLLIGVGLLGGFTTFSAFSAELITLVQRGHILLSFAYGSVSMIAGMTAFLIGLVMIQSAP
ncbi:MAG: fluoride efflux transporter CrcB [Erythrobacter sp.]